jgi:hypothetical protein
MRRTAMEGFRTMRKRNSCMSAVLAALAVTVGSGVAAASSHREAPAISEDPAADNTDLYAWVQGDKLVILANYIPLEEPAGGPNFHKFSDDVLYEVHLARGGSSLDDAITYQFRFKSTDYPYHDPANLDATPSGGNEFFSQIAGSAQTFTLTKIDKNGAKDIAKDVPVAPANIGPRTNAIAYGITGNDTYETKFTAAPYLTDMAGEGRVWAGPRDDGFYVDLGGIFDLAGLRGAVPIAPGAGVDNVAGYNCHTLALEIPLKVANGGTDVQAGQPGNAAVNTPQTVGVWASASRRKVRILRKNGGDDWLGPWVQVSRIGLPLINEAVIGLQDKDKWNRLRPKDDVGVFAGYFLNPVLVRDAKFAGLYDVGGALYGIDFDAAKTGRTDILDVIGLKDIPAAGSHAIAFPAATGDVLRVDLGLPSQFPNGRALSPGANTEQVDVTDVMLSLLLTKLAVQLPVGVPDSANSNDATFRSSFPFLATPWEGFSQGHGKVTSSQ